MDICIALVISILYSETEKKATLDQALRGVLEEQIVSYLYNSFAYELSLYGKPF